MCGLPRGQTPSRARSIVRAPAPSALTAIRAARGRWFWLRKRGWREKHGLSGGCPPPTTVTPSTGQALSWEGCPALGPKGGAAAAGARGQGLWSLEPRGAASRVQVTLTGTHVTRTWGWPLQERACVPATCPTRFLCVFEKSGDSLWSPDLPKPGEASGCARGRQTRVEGTLASADLLGPHSRRGLGRVCGQGPSVPANLAALWRAQGLSEPASEGILIRSPPCRPERALRQPRAGGEGLQLQELGVPGRPAWAGAGWAFRRTVPGWQAVGDAQPYLHFPGEQSAAPGASLGPEAWEAGARAGRPRIRVPAPFELSQSPLGQREILPLPAGPALLLGDLVKDGTAPAGAMGPPAFVLRPLTTPHHQVAHSEETGETAKCPEPGESSTKQNRTAARWGRRFQGLS